MFYDQAAGLRKQINISSGRLKPTKIITITSGKGGVGKSNFTLNFALGLIDQGLKTAILDADIGLANIDILMGITPKHSLLDLMNYHMKIWDIIETGPNGLEFISGGSELHNIFDFNESKTKYLYDQLLLLNGYVETLLIDTGAGLSKESLKFILSSDEVILVTTPEPTAITDAYAMIKAINAKKKDVKMYLVVNRVTDEQEGLSTANRLKLVSERFLDFDIQLLGYIYDDNLVSKSVKKQEPFYLSYPNSSAAKDIRLLVDKYINNRNIQQSYGVRSFLSKMTYWFRS